MSCISWCTHLVPRLAMVLSPFLRMSEMLRRTYLAPNRARSKPFLRRLILVKSTVGMTLASLARVLSLLEKRMQSVLRIKQIARLRVSLVAPLTWPVSARSARLCQACRTDSVRRRTRMRGVWLLPRLSRVAHRSRHRRRRTAEDRRTVSDGNSQDREKT